MKRIISPENLKKILAGALALLTTLSLSATPARADLFQYTDQNGTVVMVDDESKIPPQYRKKVKSTKSGMAGGSRVTPVRMRDNQAIVPVRITYRNTTVDAWLLLDTGATVTVLSSKLAERLGIRQESTRSRLSQVADGRVIETFRTHVDLLDVGAKQKYNTEVAIMPINGPVTGFDGLLGMSFLEGLRYHLDLNTQTIEWQ